MDTLRSNTPLMRSVALDAHAGMELWFKMDCLQATRSFKLRGMEYLVRHHLAHGHRRFVGSSGGNAGLSLAYVGRKLGCEVHMFVAETATERMRSLIAAEGAILTVVGESWQEAHAEAVRAAAETGAVLVQPFDDELLWAGHATMIHECALVMPEPDWVVLAVGGGGLLCGVMQGMEDIGWKKAKLLAAETEGAASYARSLEAGRLVSLDRIDTVATSLGAKRVAEEAFAWSRRRSITSYVCTDVEAVSGVRMLADAFGMIVEPACGASLAAVEQRANVLSGGKKVLVIVCGGAAIDLRGLEALSKGMGLA